MFFDKITLLCLCLYIPASYQSVKLSPRIFGPGLDPENIVLPARYITIELNLNHKNDIPIEFKASGLALDQNRPCRVWFNVLDRKDGSYIARYKLYESCTNFQLDITHKTKHIGDSPYKFPKAIIKHELCYCPNKQLSSWVAENCGALPEQIPNDLQHFKSIDFNQIRTKIITQFNKPEAISICHYIIVRNKVHRKCYGKHVGFKIFMDNILLSLLRKMRFPDMEFFVNLGDWPLVKINDREKAPVLSWCGSDDTYDMVLPTYDITESTLENMGRVTLDMLSVQGNSENAWEKRIAKVFWRGRDSHPSRLGLIDIAREQPDLFNVSITNFFFYRDKIEKYGPKTPHVSFYKFFDYKYQVSIDGTVAAYRFPYLLAGGSLVFKQDSKYYEYFYRSLKAGEHYIPLKGDLSDLLDKLKWALDNDQEAKLIAANAQRFANENLLPLDIFCYHGHLFNEYSKLLNGTIRLLDDMEQVPQPNESQNYCDCLKAQKDEL